MWKMKKNTSPWVTLTLPKGKFALRMGDVQWVLHIYAILPEHLRSTSEPQLEVVGLPIKPFRWEMEGEVTG
jgi:hypothetical protein